MSLPFRLEEYAKQGISVKQVASRAAFTLVSCVVCSSTLKMEAICSSEIRSIFNELHCVIFQNIELFITIAVRTSNPIVIAGYRRAYPI
jgi:hypothetical protein